MHTPRGLWSPSREKILLIAEITRRDRKSHKKTRNGNVNSINMLFSYDKKIFNEK